MKSHLAEEILLAVRDREPVGDEVLAHIDACGTCARALEEARRRGEEVERALAALMEPGRIGARAVASGPGRPDVAAGTGGRVVPIVRGRRDAARGTPARGSVRRLWWLGRAAVVVLVAAGALSALPGPFNGWIPRMLPGRPPATVPMEPVAGRVGGRMAVSDGPVAVRLETVPAGTVIEVRPAADRTVGVLAGTGSEFSYGGGEVRANIVAGPVTVELPEGVVPATLVVNGGVYLVMGATGMEVPGPAGADREGSIATFQVPD